MIKLIVDSTCDLPEEIYKDNDISVLPLRVFINNKEYLDRVDISIEEVYNAMRKNILPKTSQVAPSEIYKVFEKLCNEDSDFIYLAFSAAMSGTCNLAANILEEFKEKYPERKMIVIDSKSGSTGIGLIVMQALKMIEKGYDFKTIVEQINEMVNHIEHIFTLTDLNWIMKGGRITKTEAVVGTMLDLKPILDVNNGYIEVTKKVRGKKKSLNTLVDILEERSNSFPDQIIGIAHADDLETAENLKNIIKERFGENTEFTVNKIGCVLGSHLGIGGVGILFFNKKLNLYIK